MSSLARLGWVGLALATPTMAQQLAYPQDTLRGTTGIVAPFGGWATSNAMDQARFQQAFLPRHLPSPGDDIRGFWIHSQVSGSLTYLDLTITLSHMTGTNLSPTFANNLPNPEVVFTGARTIQWANDWTRILFTNRFSYDGSSTLVLDIRKAVDRFMYLPANFAMACDADSGRTDYPEAIWALNSSATEATTRWPYPLQVRWIFADTPTLFLQSDPGGPRHRTFALGTSVLITVGGNYGSPVWTFMHHTFQAPSAIPGIRGRAWIPLQYLFDWGSVTSQYTHERPVFVPTDSALVGGHIVFQAIVADPSGFPVSFTNAMDCFINE